MIQVQLKNGQWKRFSKRIEGINLGDIAYQKELTEDEILKVPTIKGKKIVMVDRVIDPIVEQNKQRKSEIEKMISEKTRENAIQDLLDSGQITNDDRSLIN